MLNCSTTVSFGIDVNGKIGRDEDGRFYFFAGKILMA